MSIRYEERVKVTRSLANKLLGVNLDYNRKKKEAKIVQYAADMREGNWRDNGDTIRVTGPSLDDLGKLIDGQNRLIAFLESGMRSMYFDFAFGVPEEAYPTINTGAARTFADVARSVDPDNANVNGAIVRRIWLWERGKKLVNKGGGTKFAPSHTQLLHRMVENVKEFHTASIRGKDGASRKLGPASIIGTAFYLYYQVDQDQAHTFFEQVITGANLREEAPALVLRNKLLRDRRELTMDEMLILWIKAWNLFREDVTIKGGITLYGFQGKPYTNDTFPEPK